MNYLFSMNEHELQALIQSRKTEIIPNIFSDKYIVKGENKEKFSSNIVQIDDDISFINDLLWDCYYSVKDVTRLSEDKVKELSDRSVTALSKIELLKNTIIQFNEIFEQEKLYNIDGRNLVSFIGNMTETPVIEIPNGIEKICSKAFNNVEGAVKIILPDSVKVIEEDSFYKCRTLIQVIVPEHFKHLEGKPLEYCRMAKYYLKNEK